MDMGLFDFCLFYLVYNDSNSLVKYFYTSTILDHLWFPKGFKKINLTLNYYFFLDVYGVLGTHGHECIFQLQRSYNCA
jgi:hypothetical protein